MPIDPAFAYPLLVAVGFLAGAINAVAGGGGFLTLPALLAVGLTPVLANASGSVAVWPGSLAGLFAYRRELREAQVPVARFIAIGVVGGVVGAELLVHGGNRAFAVLLPWLLLLATVLFAFGDRLMARFLHEDPALRPRWIAPTALAAIAVYGGYFGGGMGIMTLAMLALLGMRDIHRMNGVKALLVGSINGAGITVFILKGTVAWAPCLAMMAGAICGGYLAGRIARRLDRTLVRRAVLGFAIAMTVWFFFAAYGPAQAPAPAPAAAAP